MGFDYTVVRQLPVATAASWYLVALWSVTRRRWGSQTEIFFFLFSALVGTWALLDWLFLNSADPATAVLISKVRMSTITGALYCGLIFSRRLAHRRGWVDLLLLAPLAAALFIIWAYITVGVVMEPWGPFLIRDQFFYGLWIGCAVGSGGTSVWYIVKALRPVLHTDPALGGRLKVIIAAWLLTLGLWLGLSVYANLFQASTLPSFSIVLIVPALLIIFFLVPLPRTVFTGLTRRLATPGGTIKGIYLFNRQGEILGAAGAAMDGPGGERLGGILRSMEEFVRRSLDQGPRGRLRSLRQEGFTILVESGTALVLAAIVEGEPHDLLRGELKEVVSMLEVRPGTDKASNPEVHRVLEALLRPREVF